MHFETFRLGNHPSRHRKERDNAALLTQEGNSAHSRLPISLCGKSIREAVAKRGFGFQKRPRVILDRSSPGPPLQGRMDPYELCSRMTRLNVTAISRNHAYESSRIVALFAMQQAAPLPQDSGAVTGQIRSTTGGAIAGIRIAAMVAPHHIRKSVRKSIGVLRSQHHRLGERFV